MEASTELVRLLMEIGFVGMEAGLADDAIKVFDGVQAVRPDSEMPLIGRSIVQMSVNRPEDAVATLETATKMNPKSLFVKSYLGMALKLAGKSWKGRAVLNDVVATKGDAAAVALAQRLLQD